MLVGAMILDLARKLKENRIRVIKKSGACI